MEHRHLTADEPEWPAVLRRLAHDFYHRPDYCLLDGERQQAEEVGAFWAGEGDREFFIPYLLRHCGSLFPGEPAAAGTRDAISPYGYPGLLLSDSTRQSPDFAQRAMQRLGDTFRERGVCAAFFRMNPFFSTGLPELFPAHHFSTPTETVAMDLSLDETGIWKNIRDGHQWTIRKCKRLGFEARMVPLHEHIDAFMEVYRETMDRVHARDSYYFGRDYFVRLAEMGDQVHCCFVENAGELAAACVFLECGGLFQAHLGGTKSAFLAKSPFHLALFHAAEWAKPRGNRYLHLGGGVGGADDRLLSFKRGFSPLAFPFFTLRLIPDPEKYRALTALSARAAGVPLEDQLQGHFFPAYRAPR